ncbi:myotubularin-related protein 14 isoform X2 [Callorhinchus milii]|uniref:Myotubularin-related protein 14 n=1 Tax=Callorhinchus milii TaxID=7868 RepID=V9KDS0_CALMI|nr:myotubularin-related protein 14 isoform X2 [Callorhinchus milii]|eukprot:gi/632946194/ref/XP_007888438.1/ PREDICTED: myotubularin-related protein 14 isoform X2 [Callorhinchus milii]
MWEANAAGIGPGGGGRSEEIAELIEHCSKHQYRAKEVSSQVDKIQSHCLDLFKRDYVYSLIQNPNGEVCGHYPRQIVFMEYASTESDKERFESTVQTSKLQELVTRSKMARCRGRFVCPVILYNGKHICRSATLAGWGELYGRSGYNYLFSGGSEETGAELDEVPDDYAVRNGDSQLFDKVRGHDIKLLRYLSVHYIFDLMVEKKKVKFGLNVTSSEKVDKAQRYADFILLSIPYPGCEFFKDYKDRDYTAEGLVFNWKQDFVDAPLNIPPTLTENLSIDWRDYQSWDLVQQTQNYLKLLIHTINRNDDSGLLVHCISGWDRTPLFVSLLRLSLWADGLVHVSLQPVEILYLTIAYDWFLFGHMLPDRLIKGEEIFFFCFNFLKHITSEEFCAVKKPRRKITDLPAEDLCLLGHTERGSSTSLSSEFSVITEESPTIAGAFNYEAVDLTAGPAMQVAWRRGRTSSPQTVVWNKQHSGHQSEDRLFQLTISEGKPSFNQVENNLRTGSSSPLAVPERRFPIIPERRAKLEEVRAIFLAAYSSTVGLKSVSSSPSAFGGLLEQFARGVGLRGTNSIV